jgi:DNA-binding CsgD family transcriptional regulator
VIKKSPNKPSDTKLVQFCQNFLQEIIDPVSVMDREFRILWGSRAKAAEHRLKQADMIGKICYEVFFKSSDPCRQCAAKKVLESRKPCRIEKRCSLPNVGQVWCEQRAVPVLDENHKIARIIIHSRNITDEKLQQESQKKYIEILEEKITEITQCESKGILPIQNPKIIAPLTTRETEVLQLMSNGLTNSEISQKLAISRHTTKSHVNNIFNKLGVYNRTQAAVLASLNDLIPPVNIICNEL